MSLSARKLLLQINGIALIIASTVAFFALDILGIFFGKGPARFIFEGQEFVGIGFFEAHGLAFILGVLLFRAEPRRSWHIVAVAIHVLLGTANILMWGIFIAVNSLLMGYGTTAMHWIFVFFQLLAVFYSTKED
ncbi:hypothetical protein [Leptospira mayottensis]|uniref:Uncharacterized protein n=1 Tax=Leptospira mayottensis TaxID=1137606 RepID=A0ABM6Y656_9LEPT|nr:hypothetical protein [Leptospira mayottensis]AXR59480.1 hypothetical protein DQM68_00885 [Leptospira mayottensis]AXR63264.1 hypothetical protein DQM28_02505 [Leptospira mayottensis]AXR67029.1 hypothetical protein DPV73_02390 [Leptospira mayottensis]AZQ01199.1 hypothetical protein LEP1GSC190_03100 [Leptospira mayottensis 200901116]TGM96721.1 hypothetical protein EHR03_15625 [Leptospira mayottensis]